MGNLEWLRATGLRYLKIMDSEDVIFLSQIELSSEEQTLLLKHLKNGRPLPWTDWANACVAMAAVQVARDATGDERSLPRLFLTRLTLPYDQQRWEEEFGKRIEYVLKRFFPDDYVGAGAGRYVGPVYRHVGVPALAIRRFGDLVRKLLDHHGPSFTRPEYELLRQRLGGIASGFLASEHGYLYTKNSARILNDIDLGRIPESEIDNIPGFRRGFWAEIVAGGARRAHGAGSCSDAVQYSDPFLALSLEELELEIRFDWRGVQRGLYSLNGSSLAKASERCSCEAQPWIEVAGKRFLLERWWSPGLTKAALFRTSDGGFVTGRGGVPPGRYFLAAQEEDDLSAEWIEEESGYLGATEWRIWRVALPARCEIPALDIYTTGQLPLPVLEFVRKRRHPLGQNIFEGELPQLLIRNWDETNAARFWVVLETDSASHPLDVPMVDRLQVLVACPSTGLVKLQPRGLVRQESALSVLPFAVVPPGFKVSFSKHLYAGDEPARVECNLPKGWRVIWRGEERNGGWEIPAQETTLDAVAYDGVVKIDISVRIPRVSILVVGGEGGICWGSSEVLYVCVQGPSGCKFELVLAADGVPVALTSMEVIPKNGTLRLPGGHFNDALRSCGLAAAEFAIRLMDGTLVRSGHHYASAESIREEMAAVIFPATISKLPGVGALLALVRRMFSEVITSFDWSQAALSEELKGWFATMAYCARIFDRTTVEGGDPVGYVDPAIVSVCAWYGRASVHGQTGEASKRVLDEIPAELPQFPVERWRVAFRKAIEDLELQADVPKLVEEWRAAIRRSVELARETGIGKRAGGGGLCVGARHYLIANLKEEDSKARNSSFNSAISELEECRSTTDCLLVRAIAATLLRFAYQKTGRTNMLSDALRQESLWAELDQIEVSPWQGDYGSTKFAAAG